MAEAIFIHSSKMVLISMLNVTQLKCIFEFIRCPFQTFTTSATFFSTYANLLFFADRSQLSFSRFSFGRMPMGEISSRS
jgi:hypothetical protein